MTPESLAARLESGWCPIESPKDMERAAAELRRLAAVEAERDALLETFAKVCARLDIDTEAARKQPGKPSDVLIGAIDAEQDALKVALECERMRVVACGVVACSDTPKSAAVARDMLPVYRSASCDDVARRVDECISLRAERDALLAAIPEGCTPADAATLRAANHQLAAERDALRADAERYRWLRQGDNDEEVLRFHEWATEVWVDPPPMYLPRLERLDRVIDAARENEDMLNDALLHPGMSPKSVSGTPEPTPSPAPSFFESLASMRFDNEPVVHAFAVHVLRQTGRDLAYHKAAGTTGIEFGLSCWQAAMAHAREAVESVPVPRTWDFVTSRHAWITAQDFDDYRVAVLRALGGK